MTQTPDTIWSYPGLSAAVTALNTANAATASSPASDVAQNVEAAKARAVDLMAIAERAYGEMSLRAKSAESERDALRAQVSTLLEQQKLSDAAQAALKEAIRKAGINVP